MTRDKALELFAKQKIKEMDSETYEHRLLDIKNFGFRELSSRLKKEVNNGIALSGQPLRLR